MKPLTPEIEYCRATVKWWERMRLLYNGIMLVAGVAVLWRALYLQGQSLADAGNPPGYVYYPLGHPLELVATSLIFGFVANVCYCLGPYCEFVITAVGFPLSGKRARWFLFGLGVLGSLALVVSAWLYLEFFMLTPLVTGP